MKKKNFNNLSVQDKLEVFNSIVQSSGLPTAAIEKDWWVVTTLRIIFQMDIGQHLLFKGGTSLSKAWGLIERFSEDLDFALNREFFHFDSGLISKSQVKKLRSVSFQYITDTFMSDLQKAFEASGFKNLKFDFENLGDSDQDPVSILIYYPTVAPPSAYLPPRIKVEIGSRSLKDPFSERSITSLVGLQYPDQPFSDPPIKIPCINPERTYLEKLFLLHEEFQKPTGKIRVNRLSRHLYDIWKIASSKYKPDALNTKLIREIIAHRKRFNGMKGVDYSSLLPPNLNPIPPKEYIDAWKDDYTKMKETMIHGESPSFSELIEAVKEAAGEFNGLTI